MKKVYNIFLFLATWGLFFSLTSCQKYFLEKKIGSDLTVDSVFATQQKSLAAIAQAYSISLVSGITVLGWDGDRTYGLKGGTLSHLSGELNAVKFNWEDAWKIQHNGMTSNDGSGTPLSSDGFNANYRAIRQCYLVIENIHKVNDMSEAAKNQVRAEMKTLIAYRYLEMMKRYGGVPVFEGLLSTDMELMLPRATVEDVLKHIVKLCDEALPDLPAIQEASMKGRVNKGIAMAIKAEAYMFIARPLFNSATPYMNFGENNNLICLGRTDASYWQKAIDANLEVLSWANSNGHSIINTGKPFEDYATAVATPGNPEVLLAYKSQNNDGMANYNPRTQGGGANAMSYIQLTQYHKTDGSNQTWTNETWAPYTEYTAKVNELEPRFKASATVAGQDSWNNPGSYPWSTAALSGASDWDGRAGTEGAGRRVKFWYLAGPRNWFEFPIYRLAETYLNLAEAYNEINNPAEAHQYLNVIRKRAGLPNVTESSQARLREIIQREWAVEFYEENHRYFDVKHWKLADLGNGIIGGSKKAVVFQYKNGSNGTFAWDYSSYAVKEAYVGFWAPSQHLDPFPIAEVNKGYIKQNPGY